MSKRTKKNDALVLIDDLSIPANQTCVDKDFIVAANNLVNKLQEMYKSPEYQEIFMIASLYQNPYNGPSAISELLDLKKHLEKHQNITNQA